MGFGFERQFEALWVQLRRLGLDLELDLGEGLMCNGGLDNFLSSIVARFWF